jgi:hypothetical protein
MDTMQAVSTPQGTGLQETGPQFLVGESAVLQLIQEPVTYVWIRIELKPERVEEPGVAQAEETGAWGLELVIRDPQPVTFELAEPKVTITLHGNPAKAAGAA